MSAYDQNHDSERRQSASRPQVDGRREDDPVSTDAMAHLPQELHGVFHLHFNQSDVRLSSGAVTIFVQPPADHEGTDQT